MARDFKAVGLTATGGGLLLGAAVYLFKTSFERWLEQDAERFKARLKADVDAEVERLKSSLQMAALEHQVRFTKLHERRAEVIAEVYQRLAEVYEKSRIFASTTDSDPERRFKQYNDIYMANWELVRFLDARRIYLPVQICSVLDTCLRILNKGVIDVNIYSKIDFPSSPQMTHEKNQALIDAYIAITDEAPKMKTILEAEFRKILGEN